jgi:predicted type IV restriction endonuclease
MGFAEDIAKLSEQIRSRLGNVSGEEATKQALILPFFGALGYDVWDPMEVRPEYISDASKKKAGQFEKVDYAIAINDSIVMLVEAKARDQKAEAHDGQLGRYFTWTLTAKVGIVTNGVEYRFFTDLRNKNIMDKEPFFVFNVLAYDAKDIENLKLFHRDNFDAMAIGRHAEEMVYVEGMTKFVGDILRTPSEEFIRFLVGGVGKVSPACEIEGKVTSRVVDKFRPIIKKSIQNSLVALMTRSITQEMGQSTEDTATTSEHGESINTEPDDELLSTEDAAKIITTEEELEAFARVQVIAATSTSFHHTVGYKDVESYFGVHVGKPGWWFMRFYLSPKRKSLVARLSIQETKALAPEFEVQEVSTAFGGEVSRVVITSIEDLDKLKALVLKCYEAEAGKHPVAPRKNS